MLDPTMLCRGILKAQEEAVTKDSTIDFTSLFVYPLLAASLFANMAVGGKMLDFDFDLPNLSPLISLAIDQLNPPFDDIGDISKIDHIESKVDQDFSDFGSSVDFTSNLPASKYEVDENSAMEQFISGEEPPLLQLTNLLTTKLLSNLGDDVVWPRIKKKEENAKKEEQHNPIRMLKKIRVEKENVFGKKKHFVRRKHVNQLRDK